MMKALLLALAPLLASAKWCPEGKYSAASCQKCPTGYMSYSGEFPCQPCAPGKYSNSDNTWCLDCDAGYYNPSSAAGTCSACGPGTFSTAGSTGCDVCEPGWIAASTGSSACTECPAGTISNTERTECLECAAGSFSGAGQASCDTCGVGLFSAAGQPACTKCGDDPSIWDQSWWDPNLTGMTHLDECKCQSHRTGADCQVEVCGSTTPVVSLGFLLLDVQWPLQARSLSKNEAYSGISGALRSFDANSDDHLSIDEARTGIAAGGMAVPEALVHIWSENGRKLTEGQVTITQMIQDELDQLEVQKTVSYYDNPSGSGNITSITATYPHTGPGWNNNVCEGNSTKSPVVEWTVDRKGKFIFEQCIFYNGEALNRTEGLNDDVSSGKSNVDGADCSAVGDADTCKYEFHFPEDYEVKSYHQSDGTVAVLPISKQSYCVQTKFCTSSGASCSKTTTDPALTVTRCIAGLQYDGTPADVFPRMLGRLGVSISFLSTSPTTTVYRIYKYNGQKLFRDDTSRKLLREVELRMADCGLTISPDTFRDTTTGAKPGLDVAYAVVPLVEQDGQVTEDLREDRDKVGKSGFLVPWMGDIHVSVAAQGGGGPVIGVTVKLSHLVKNELDPEYTNFIESETNEYGRAVLQVRVQDRAWSGLTQNFRVTVEKTSKKEDLPIVHKFHPSSSDAGMQHLGQTTVKFADQTAVAISAQIGFLRNTL